MAVVLPRAGNVSFLHGFFVLGDVIFHETFLGCKLENGAHVQLSQMFDVNGAAGTIGRMVIARVYLVHLGVLREHKIFFELFGPKLFPVGLGVSTGPVNVPGADPTSISSRPSAWLSSFGYRSDVRAESGIECIRPVQRGRTAPQP